jgi:hypothetical protein
MARGWESKAVESQQQDMKGAGSKGRPEARLTEAQRASIERRRTLELARARTLSDLRASTSSANRAMLEQALRALDEQLRQT